MKQTKQGRPWQGGKQRRRLDLGEALARLRRNGKEGLGIGAERCKVGDASTHGGGVHCLRQSEKSICVREKKEEEREHGKKRTEKKGGTHLLAPASCGWWSPAAACKTTGGAPLVGLECGE